MLRRGLVKGWEQYDERLSIPFSKEDGLKQISKGRTIRKVIMANLVWGTLGCWVYFAVFGVNSIHIELHSATSMTELLAATTPENAIATILSTCLDIR